MLVTSKNETEPGIQFSKDHKHLSPCKIGCLSSSDTISCIPPPLHYVSQPTVRNAFQCIPRINVPPRMKYNNPPKAHSFKISFPQPAPKPHQSDPDLPTPTFSVLHLDRHYHHPEGNGERRHRHPCVKRRRRKFLTFWCVSLLWRRSLHRTFRVGVEGQGVWYGNTRIDDDVRHQNYKIYNLVLVSK